MRYKNAIQFISLLIIAVLAIVPLITAQGLPGGNAGGLSGGSSGGSAGGLGGGSPGGSANGLGGGLPGGNAGGLGGGLIGSTPGGIPGSTSSGTPGGSTGNPGTSTTGGIPGGLPPTGTGGNPPGGFPPGPGPSGFPPTTNPQPTPHIPDVSRKDELSVHIGSIRFLNSYETAGDIVPMTISFENNGNEKLEDIKVAMLIQDLAIRSSVGPFDLRVGERITKTLYVQLPAPLEQETYFVRITINSGSMQRVIHREIEVA